ncbi:hypothetical protein RIF29_34626 [Crotalaria pallida]|uniref:Uncharacterized protein n=1 Tax=Crotalaria pallida TaxID=3830 RepID=A0AAN9EBB9_CROPI
MRRRFDGGRRRRWIGQQRNENLAVFDLSSTVSTQFKRVVTCNSLLFSISPPFQNRTTNSTRSLSLSLSLFSFKRVLSFHPPSQTTQHQTHAPPFAVTASGRQICNPPDPTAYI